MVDAVNSEQKRIPLPKPLLVVAGLFIAVGLDGIIWQVIGFLKHENVYRLDFLFIFVGIGLLRRRLGWWKWAETFLVLGMVACGLGAVLLVATLGLCFAARELAMPDGLWLCLLLPVSALIFWIQLWMFRVLHRPEIEDLFER